jgi:3-methyl-2-oxobutanoate hydroxymethyltransferase
MSQPAKWTAARIKTSKGKEKLSCLTAYDFATARIMDEAGIPLVLVGDSLAMTMLGYENTLPVTVEEMLHHTAAVVRGTRTTLVVADMPFMSYQVSVEQALHNAGRFVKSTGAGAVKLEGGTIRVPTVKALIENGIPVLGHIGLTPQSIKEMGGYKVQGRTAQQADELIRDACALEEAGIFALVLECLPEDLGAEITKAVGIPTIGIGAGRYCDGQILVVHDMLGLHSPVSPKFVKRYAELGESMRKAFCAYRKDVETGKFPSAKYRYT